MCPVLTISGNRLPEAVNTIPVAMQVSSCFPENLLAYTINHEGINGIHNWFIIFWTNQFLLPPAPEVSTPGSHPALILDNKT